MTQKDMKRREKEIRKEHEDEEDSEDGDYQTGDLTEEQSVEDPWKGVTRNCINMKKLAPLVKVAQKITVRKVHKTAPKLLKCDPFVWDALSYDGMDKIGGPTHSSKSVMYVDGAV
jgi:hypothetical protein